MQNEILYRNEQILIIDHQNCWLKLFADALAVMGFPVRTRDNYDYPILADETQEKRPGLVILGCITIESKERRLIEYLIHHKYPLLVLYSSISWAVMRSLLTMGVNDVAEKPSTSTHLVNIVNRVFKAISSADSYQIIKRETCHMSRQGRILVMDDLEKWRKLLRETLTGGDFQVDTASTTAQALERLVETFYHLLVFDIRMEDPDPTNTEGMQLLDKLAELNLTSAVEVVMLSSYGTTEQMREAFRDYSVVDFIDKGEYFDNLEFLQQVRELFKKKVRVNLDLDVHWQGISSVEQVVLNLEVDGTRIKRDSPSQSRMAAELEDLLCRLFFQADSLIVRPLTRGSYSGAGVLLVQPFFTPGGAGQGVVVKFGDFRKIDQEYRNFKAYVEPFVGGGRSTTIRDLRRTPWLGGIIYSLLGLASRVLEDFDSFYRRADISQIKQVLDRLFQDTCGVWYGNLGPVQPLDLTLDYQQTLNFTPEKLEQAAKRLKSVQGKDRLHFRALSGDRTFRNPILATANQVLVRPTYVCTTHGDLNEHNILVDEDRHTWLIDFFHTGPGHILRDIVKLDAVVRFQLLAAEEASLEERLKMEEALLSLDYFSQGEQPTVEFPTENPALAKAFVTSMHLRSLAYKLVDQNPNSDVNEYHIASLYHAMNTIRYYSLDRLQREHAILSAGLLAEHLRL